MNIQKSEYPGLSQLTSTVSISKEKLKVCIAAEDIVGPIRNGGIGTTYTHLARLLAQAGHEVVIAYLRGSYCQNDSIQHWIYWYREFGVSFVPVYPENIELDCPAPRWIKPMYALYEYLKRETFDIVHVSEWRGSGFLALLAKKQGLALRDTLFCVKASSPWLWNREHGYHLLDWQRDLPKIFAEKRSVELADMVISGSQYMLNWMLDHDYKIPERSAYVQPNVVVPADLEEALVASRQATAGSRIPVDEIVFFGRLEYRKGLDIFFDAIDILIAQKISLPPITLMGKYGAKIPTYPELSIEEFIAARTRAWPFPVKVLDNFGNEDALRYLLGAKRLAVMPSRIENSTLTVYEAAYYGIPCIASGRGGTAELIAPQHREAVLTDPDPRRLAEKIVDALSHGGFIPRLSFNNDENLSEWLAFHNVAGGYLKESRPAALQNQATPEAVKISVCVAIEGDYDYLQAVGRQLSGQTGDGNVELVIITYNSGSSQKVRQLLGEFDAGGVLQASIVEQGESMCEQAAQNHAARIASGDLLVFLERGAVPKADFIASLRQASACSEAVVFSSFYDQVTTGNDLSGDSNRCAIFIGDYTSSFYGLIKIIPMIAVRKDIFEKVGGFREDGHIPGANKELVAMIILDGQGAETVPEALVWYVEQWGFSQRMNYSAEPYRTIRPFVELAPAGFTPLLLTARSAVSAKITSDEGGMGAIRDPINFLEGQARQVANAANSSPRIRNIGWKIYYLNIRIFRKMLALEIRVFRLLLRMKHHLVRGK